MLERRPSSRPRPIPSQRRQSSSAQAWRSAVAAVTSACSGISGSPSLPALLEIAQVRWRLVLARRHQQAVRAQHVVLLADGDVRIAFGADVLEPDEVALAAILFDDRPGARERIVDGGDLVDQDVGIALVERDALLDDGLVVLVQRKPGGLEGARALEIARLDLERVVAAIAIGIEPLADRVARK